MRRILVFFLAVTFSVMITLPAAFSMKTRDHFGSSLQVAYALLILTASIS